VSTILVVDDEEAIAQVVGSYLLHAGYQVVTAASGAEALQKVDSLHPDLVVLDLMLPDIHGEEVARTIRSSSDLPIIMLTAKSGQEDRIAGLAMGTDDYLVKPFSPRELVLRVKNILRRVNHESEQPVQSFGRSELVIDRAKMSVSFQGSLVELTPSEYKLLVTLAENPGRPFTRSELITRTQGYDYPGFDRVIDAHVKNLRRKLGEDSRSPTYIQTVYGVGYKFGGTRDAK
jgi:DNA-binding response OmpR family regulator